MEVKRRSSGHKTDRHLKRLAHLKELEYSLSVCPNQQESNYQASTARADLPFT